MQTLTSMSLRNAPTIYVSVNILSLLILTLVVVVLFAVKILNRPKPDLDYALIEKMDFSGIKLLMGEPEFLALAGKGNPVAGCIGCKIYSYYPEWNITVAVSDSLGKFHKNKVVGIETEDRSYSILGVKTAMSLAEADQIMKEHGFTLSGANDHIYSKGDLNITLSDYEKDGNIDKISVYVLDKLPKDVVH